MTDALRRGTTPRSHGPVERPVQSASAPGASLRNTPLSSLVKTDYSEREVNYQRETPAAVVRAGREHHLETIQEICICFSAGWLRATESEVFWGFFLVGYFLGGSGVGG